MKKIVITGATSMLGVALTQAAVSIGIEVYAIIRKNTTRLDRMVSDPLVHIVYASLDELDKISNDDIPEDCEALYHFAWMGTEKTTRDDPVIQEKNIGYTLKAVELAERVNCRKFIFSGSQAEYGPVYETINSDTAFNPVLAYGMAKYSAGMLSRLLCDKKGLDHIWARVFSVYGPHDNAGTMLDYAIRTWENGETAEFSSGKQYWNYLYETDAGEMFVRLCNSEIASGTYFIAGKESVPLRQYIESMMEVYGDGAKSTFSDSEEVKLSGLNVNMESTLKILNYEPRVSFEDGIKMVIDTVKSNKKSL